jgi:hypothetical protein
MGVMRCGRSNCDNIMCDKSININHDWWYICERCLDELEVFRQTWPESVSVEDIDGLLLKFMDSNVSSHKRYSTYEEIEKEFRNRIRTY